jgi:glycosyltransferase involved in cell wall biosynthesis
MRILYICDKLITFILNEIIELKESKNDVFILSDHKDKRIFNNITKPILAKSGLLDNTFCRFSTFQNRKQKLIFLSSKLIYDFFVHPVVTIKTFIYILKIYPHPKFGFTDYLDIRHFFGLRIDIIHAPFSTPQIIDKTYFLSKVLNLPFTLSFRAHDIYKGNNFSEIKQRARIISEASQIITISDYNKRYLKSNLLIHKKDIEIIHSAVNLGFFKPKDVVRSNKSIIAVCGLHEQKGLIYLIKACHILNKRNIDYECTIIGEGSEKKRYERIIEELQIPNFNFIDYLPHDEIKEYLSRSTVFVLPCVIASDGTRDILANALKEAMAMKVPVVTSNICGIEALVDDGINGILVPPKDPEAIAEAIEKLFIDSDLREKMGEAGRKKIEKDFNVKNEVRKLEIIFKKAVNENILH